MSSSVFESCHLLELRLESFLLRIRILQSRIADLSIIFWAIPGKKWTYSTIKWQFLARYLLKKICKYFYLITKRCFGSEFYSSNAKLIVLFEMICTISRSITLFFSYFLETYSTTTTLYPTLTNWDANFPIDFSGNPQCSCLLVNVKSSTF